MRLNDLNSCFDNVAPTLEQKQRMLSIVLERKTNYKGIETMNHKNKRLIAAVAAAIVFVLTATTVLAVNLGWHEKFVEYFGAREDQFDLLDGAVGTPNISITENGVTIEVLQTLADSMGVYAIFEVTVPENVELTDATGFELFFFSADTERRDSGYGTAVSGADIIERSGNKITGIASYLPSDPITDGILRLDFLNLGYMDWPESSGSGIGNHFVTLVEGQWVLKWDFSYTDTAKKITPNIAAGTDDDFLLTEIAISPISITVRAQRKSSSSMSGLLGDTGAVIVMFKDGSSGAYRANDINSSFGATLINENDMIYEFRMYNRFDQIIDTDDIVSVTLGDITIPIE